MPNLFVSGCSFSDYTEVEINWGQTLSELLNYNYVHLNKGGGSNDRSWRELSWQILEQEITDKDLVILQYTNINRREFPSTEFGLQKITDIQWKEVNTNRFGTFYTTAFKQDSDVWQVHDTDRSLHRSYQRAAPEITWHKTHFYTQHKMFDALCKKHNINIIYLHTRYLLDHIHLHEYNQDCNILNELDYFNATEENDMCLGYANGKFDYFDNSHLSEKGHIHLANKINQYLIDNKIVNVL